MGNETEIGLVFEKALKDGLNRDELFGTSKVCNDSHKPRT